MVDITLKRRFQPHERPVTIVLKHNRTRNNGRLVHTYFYGELLNGDFEANDDDRTFHRLEDSGITWLSGHVPFDSPAAQRLLKSD